MSQILDNVLCLNVFCGICQMQQLKYIPQIWRPPETGGPLRPHTSHMPKAGPDLGNEIPPKLKHYYE
jgi:hypothetical protein